jgi:hypothetical protein
MLCVAISGAKIAMRMMSATTISPMMACGWLRSVVEMNPRRPGVRSGDPSTAISSRTISVDGVIWLMSSPAGRA